MITYFGLGYILIWRMTNIFCIGGSWKFRMTNIFFLCRRLKEWQALFVHEICENLAILQCNYIYRVNVTLLYWILVLFLIYKFFVIFVSWLIWLSINFCLCIIRYYCKPLMPAKMTSTYICFWPYLEERLSQ